MTQSLAGSLLVDRIVQELGPELARVARRAGGVGPTTEGTAVLLTGCRRGVGCTTLALALARVAAADRSVLLIDGDQTRPGLAAALGCSPGRGWDDALAEFGSLDEAFQPLFSTPPLTVLPRHRPMAESASLLAEPAFRDAYGRLRRGYDLLVLDGGSVWHGGADWAPWADVALVVCDSGNKLADDWARAWDRLEAGGTRVLGIIEILA
jgi:Mrp family chromosome partitioning ATPase